MFEGLRFQTRLKTSRGTALTRFRRASTLFERGQPHMRRFWSSLSFSFKLKLGRLVIVIELKPAVAAEERQATGET